MRYVFYWLLIVFLVSALVHISSVLVIPRVQMQAIASGITSVLPENKIQRLTPQMLASIRGFRGLDPVFKYAACHYNIGDNAVEIALPVKSFPSEVILYDEQLRVIYTTNDTSRFDDVLRILLVSDRQILRLREKLPETAQQAQFFKLENPKGTALIKIFAPRKSQLAEVNAIMDSASCEIFEDIDVAS